MTRLVKADGFVRRRLEIDQVRNPPQDHLSPTLLFTSPDKPPQPPNYCIDQSTCPTERPPVGAGACTRPNKSDSLLFLKSQSESGANHSGAASP